MPCSEDDDSQTGFSEPSQGLSKAELRKTNKPIMEKKRRARINNCLNELKDLLIDGTDKDPARHNKLEKADILELTVKHLQKMQRQQLAAAIAADPAVLHRFKSGFSDCAVEVRRYLSRLASVPTGLRHRLGNHLTSCIGGMETLQPRDYAPLVPDPLRLDDERPSAFHFVKSTRPTSPPLSPLSCDSACDSSTELETPPRPIQAFPFPTPPSRSASDQDSSPETQKPTVSSTTISPESRQEALRNKKYMEPLSIVIDVENYKIGIDASPKRAVDYSIRQKLKRSVVDLTGPAPKILRAEDKIVPEIIYRTPEKSAFTRVSERIPTLPHKKLLLPESIPSASEQPLLARSVNEHPLLTRSVTEHPILARSVSPLLARSVSEHPLLARSVTEQPLLARSVSEHPLLTRPVSEQPLLARSVSELPLTTRSVSAQPLLARSVSEHPLLTRPVSEQPLLARSLAPRTVISHTAASLAQSAQNSAPKESKVEADTSSKSPKQGSSTSAEMWRPW